MKVSAVVLFNRELWQLSYSYRSVLILLRIIELAFVTARYFLIRAPVLLMWTRLPGTRGIQPPWGHLAPALGPLRVRAPLTLGAADLGERALGEIKAREELDVVLESAARRVAAGIPAWRIVVGGVIRGLVIEWGSTFIKFAQILSMRPEMPSFLKEELALVQDRMPAVKYGEVSKLIHKELGEDPGEVFEYIEEQPIAAASLAQVNRAKLRKEQKDVAIKIQRPYLEAATTIDTVVIIDILLPLILLFLPLFRKNMNVSVFTLSFRKSLEKEIDFFVEGRTQNFCHDRVVASALHRDAIKVANVHFEYTTKRLLTMELVKDFYRLDHLPTMPEDKVWSLLTTKYPAMEEYEKIVDQVLPLHFVQAGGCLLIDMLVDWFFFHGDGHLGNLYAWVPPDRPPGIFLCDFGMFADFGPEVQGYIEELVPRLITGDGYAAMEGILRAMEEQYPKAYAKMPKESKQACKEKFGQWGERRITHATSTEWWHMRLKFMGTFSLTADLLYSLWSNPGLIIPDWVWLLYKCFAYVEEVGTTFWPYYDGANLFRYGIWNHMKRGALKELEPMNIITMDLGKVGGKLWGPVETAKFCSAVQKSGRLSKLAH